MEVLPIRTSPSRQWIPSTTISAMEKSSCLIITRCLVIQKAIPGARSMLTTIPIWLSPDGILQVYQVEPQEHLLKTGNTAIILPTVSALTKTRSVSSHKVDITMCPMVLKALPSQHIGQQPPTLTIPTTVTTESISQMVIQANMEQKRVFTLHLRATVPLLET